MHFENGELLTLVLACIAAPGFWEVIKKLIDAMSGRKRVTLDEISEKLDDQRKDLDKLKNEYTRMQGEEALKDVQSARRRILRFNDELLRGEEHSKEYFDDVLEDLKTYDGYVSSHPNFLNGKTEMAEKNIKRCYELCMEKRSFLS